MTLNIKSKLFNAEVKSNISDNTRKFIKLWNAGVPTKQIAEECNIKQATVYTKRYDLQLPTRPHKRQLARQYDKEVRAFLRKSGGWCKQRVLHKIVSGSVIGRMFMEHKIIKVKFTLKRGVGDYKRWTQLGLFKKGFYPYTFMCLNRTALVRLMQHALHKPADANMQTILSHFLRKHGLSQAEKFAVLWKLGVRNYSRSQVKSTIQIDGVVKARKRFLNE